ncbi:MAG: hypothetical protein AAF804_20230 [Bacteroidota bacterium]
MLTLSLMLSLISVSCLYATAERVEGEKRGLLRWLSQHTTLAYCTAGVAYLGALGLHISSFGWLAGLFTSLLAWMLLACMMILFAPFQQMRLHHVSLVALVAFGLEWLLSLISH